MKRVFAALSGILFGAGLAISEMTNPNKVLSFLDVSGAWDPSLAFVMGSALAVSTLAYAIARRREFALSGDAFDIPEATDVDLRLLVGAVLFGAGWGLVGLCPGPALAALVSGAAPLLVFVASMLTAIALFRYTQASAHARRA